MSKKIIALSGVSGVGKTYKRTTDPELKDLPFVDIADFYAEFPFANSATVFQEALWRVDRLMDGNDTVVLEAALLKSSNQRNVLYAFCRIGQYGLQYIEIPSPPANVLLERIKKDLDKSLEIAVTEEDKKKATKYYNARKLFITSVC